MSQDAHDLIEKWYESTLAGNDDSYTDHTEEEWLSLEQAITAALAAERRRVLIEVAESWDRMDHVELAKQFPSMDLYPKWGNIFAAWCRQRGEGEL